MEIIGLMQSNGPNICEKTLDKFSDVHNNLSVCITEETFLLSLLARTNLTEYMEILGEIVLLGERALQ